MKPYECCHFHFGALLLLLNLVVCYQPTDAFGPWRQLKQCQLENFWIYQLSYIGTFIRERLFIWMNRGGAAKHKRTPKTIPFAARSS